MAKRTRRPIHGIGPAFADALQVPPHVREAMGSEFVAAPTKRRRAASKRATTKTAPASISLGGPIYGTSQAEPTFRPGLSGAIDCRAIEATVADFERLFGPVNLQLITVGPDFPAAAEDIMGLGHETYGPEVDPSMLEPATADELEGLMRTLARGRNEPVDMSGVLHTWSWGEGDMDGVRRTLARGQ